MSYRDNLMRYGKHLLPGFFLLLCCTVFLTACATIGGYKETPRVSLVSIQPLEIGLLEQRYGLQLRIINPNDKAIPVKGLSYSIEINDHEFAYGVSRQPVSIPGLSEALLEVEVVSNLLNVMKQLKEMGDEESESLNYRLKGKISLSKSARKIPFETEGKLSWLSQSTAGSAAEK